MVVQIVILDAVFSLDAVITAVGMVNNLPVMMTAVVVAMGIMLLASKPLTNFVNAHPTVVVLCLSFLLMIGLSLVAEGFGFHIPKGYLYAAIGFSIIIELFNQIARRNFMRHQERRPMRERTAEAIQRLMGGRRQNDSHLSENSEVAAIMPQEAFKDEERYMINGVLTLASRSVRSIMTPRGEISWVDATRPVDEIRIHCWTPRTACSRFAVVNWMRLSVWCALRSCWLPWIMVLTLPHLLPLRRQSSCRRRLTR